MRLCIFSAITLFSIFLWKQGQATKDENSYAMYEASEHVSHLEYEVEVNPDVTTYNTRYWGNILITFKCIKKTNKIFLDRNLIFIKEKTIQVWKYTKEKGRRKIPVHYGRNVKDQTGYKIKLEKYMQENITYIVRLEFSNSIDSREFGFVSANYRLTHRVVRDMVYTRIDKHYAHHVFPCFNDVKMKAKFKIKIGHLLNVNCFTNTKLVTRKLVNNPTEWTLHLKAFEWKKITSAYTSHDLSQLWVIDEFAQTDLLSTFSIALAVINFDSYEPTTRLIGPPDTDLAEVKISVWAEEDLLNEYHVKEVVRVAGQSLAFFSDFFGATYDLGKLDLIVLNDKNIIVEDYYGLIYLGEKAVEYVFAKSSNYREDRYSLVSGICQASSKQWIGHLVSLSNWKYEWFYEGLHTYLQRYCVMKMFPDWRNNVQLHLIDTFINLLRSEERGDTYDPTMTFLIYAIFPEKLNPETKSKIHLIIRMLGYIMELKEKLFQKSLTNFISTYKGKNPNLTDVFNSFITTVKTEEEVHKEIMPWGISFNLIVKSWLSQSGHPLMTVTRNKTGDIITVSQERFVFPDQNEYFRCWIIPFDIITKKWKMRKWLTCENTPLEIEVPNVKKNDWIILSSQLHVPGRVQYEPDDWKLIRDIFHTENELKNIDPMVRVQLIHDMFTLAEASYLNYDFVFITLKYISLENDYKCWHVIQQELLRLRSRWSGTDLFKPFQDFVGSIIKPIFKEKIVTIGEFLNGKHSKHMLERIIILIACNFEHFNCEEYSKNLLSYMIADKYYEAENRILEFFKESFFCMAMKNADEKTWNFLLKYYEENPDIRVLRALGCSKNTSILKKYLDWSMGENNDKSSVELGLEVFEIVAASNEGYELIISFFRKRWMGLHYKNVKALNEFISKFQTKITIEDFFLKAMRATKKREDFEILQEFSKTLEDRKKENLLLHAEAYKLVNRQITWFENKAKQLSNYFDASSS